MKKIIKLLTIFALGIGVGAIYHDDIISEISPYLEIAKVLNSSNHNTNNVSDNPIASVQTTYGVHESKINLCFTPPSGCASRVVGAIENATTSIRMQAYGLTHPEIAMALVEAKKRGVDVSILLDRSNTTQKYSKMQELQAAGIAIVIDKVPGIAHNKIIIIDGHKTITGSFNFTTSADTRNAENVIIIDDEFVAKTYLQNWIRRERANR